MQAKQRREIHFKSSVGSMLNENYGYGYIQNTVHHQDFVHIPPNSLPPSIKALEFLDKKLCPPSKPQRVGSGGTGPDLYQAYRNVSGQPLGMVHYDRDPFYWPGRERPPSDYEPVKRNSINCFDYIFNEGKGYNLPTPDNTRDSAVSTPTIKSKSSSIILSSGKERKGSAMSSLDGDRNQLMKSRADSSEIPHDVRFGILAKDTFLDKSGFKAYSPFTDTSPDFDVKLGRQHTNNIVAFEDKYNSSPIPAPKYSDALNKVLDVSSQEACRMGKYSKERPADILKLHGNPEYPAQVMEEKDVPNYVAWAKIYPYCPLTQKGGKEKPVFVPPRGFTPSTPSRPPTQVKLRDLKKTKRNIMEGIKLLSSSSRKRHQLSKKSFLKDANAVNQAERSDIEIKKQSLLGRNSTEHHDYSETQHASVNHNADNDDNETVMAIEHINRSGSLRDSSPTRQACKSIMHDLRASRKTIDFNRKTGGDVWYTGKTPTRTPTPDSRLPLPANRQWIKQYSPARIQGFMEKVAKPNSQI